MKTTKLMTIAVASVLCLGCGRVTLSSAPQKFGGAVADDRPIYLWVLIDASDSGTKEMKMAYGKVSLDEIEGLQRGRDRLRVSVFDHAVREVSSEIPDDTEAFAFTLRDAIFKPTSCRACHGEPSLKGRCSLCRGTGRETVTSQPTAVATVAEGLKSIDGKAYRIRILFLSDGGYEDHTPEMEALYRRSAQSIAKISNSTVIWYGVKPGLRETVRPMWRDLDQAGRLRFANFGDQVAW